MNKLYLFVVTHAVTGAGGYLVLAGWAAGAADSGAAAGWPVQAAAAVLRYVLLQPLAYWLIEPVGLPWWTWPGLFALVAICAVNSLCVAWIVLAAIRALAARRRSAHD